MLDGGNLGSRLYALSYEVRGSLGVAEAEELLARLEEAAAELDDKIARAKREELMELRRAEL